jgi:hypothetical protein
VGRGWLSRFSASCNWTTSFERTIPKGQEDVSWSLMAQVLVICRLCNPSSELHIAEHYYRSTAMSELLGVPAEKVYDERLYRALDKLLPHAACPSATRFSRAIGAT